MENSIIHIAVSINAAILVFVLVHAKDIIDIVREWRNRRKNKKD